MCTVGLLPLSANNAGICELNRTNVKKKIKLRKR